MRSFNVLLLTAALFLLPSGAVSAQRIPTPTEHLGFEVGADRTLADWGQVLAYLGMLGSRSPAVKLDTLGSSTLGRPLVLVTISAPENMSRLNAIRAAQAQLADPRGRSEAEIEPLVQRQPAVILIQCNLHSSEIASSQMAMELAHRLATDPQLQAQLRDVVVLLIPSANPDGMQMIVDWYRAGLGQAWEGGPMPWLYHHYVGHDNNRDWFMVTQRETRLITDLLYRQWFPLVFYDMHQMGNMGVRFFVPPFVDPINPNVEPLIVRSINQLGMGMSLALEEAGKTGVADGVVYDLWWHGGARSTPTRHNMIGILSEAASVRIATPIVQDTSELTGHRRGLPTYTRRINHPNPWPGGSWTLRDIVEYQLISAEALVRMMAARRQEYVANFAALGARQITLGETQAPRAFIVPAGQRDPDAAERLVRVLLAGGVEVHQAEQRFRADGVVHDSGSFVVSMAQPYRAHAKDLLEPQSFPRIERWPGGPPERPYDVAGWTLPYQMGVRVTRVDSSFRMPRARLLRETSVRAAQRQCVGAGRARRGPIAVDARDTRSYRMAAAALRSGVPVSAARGVSLPSRRRGPAFVLAGPLPDSVARDAADCTRGSPSSSAGGVPMAGSPRIGLYRPWTANMDEGWTRWLLEDFGVQYTSVTDSVVRGGKLRDQFDVILVPDMGMRDLREGPRGSVPPAFAGGLGASGLRELEAYVRDGGRLVLLDGASELATEVLGAQVELVKIEGGADATDTTSLYAPGSILRVLVDTTHAVAFGMPDTAAVYFTNSVTFAVPAGQQGSGSGAVRVIARYPPDPGAILMSGYLQGAQELAGRAAAVELEIGRGRVVMFGFRPQFRGQSHGTFRMLFNALLLDHGSDEPQRTSMRENARLE